MQESRDEVEFLNGLRMSLTTFLTIPDVKERFLDEFPEKPKFNVEGKIMAEPRIRSYGMVGTAFDYLMRFYLERLNRKAKVVRRRWVAEGSLKLVKRPKLEYREKWRERMYEMCKAIISDAKKARSRFLKTGRIDYTILELVCRLAQMDVIYRAGLMSQMYDHLCEPVEEQNILDLCRLAQILEHVQELFRAKRICMLNPTFGSASMLVGGADADIVIDNMLIDIKTTKESHFTRKHYNQLMGYYTLSRIGGIDGVSPKPRITKLGIYYSRYGALCVLLVKEEIHPRRFPRFLKWFRKRANSLSTYQV